MSKLQQYIHFMGLKEVEVLNQLQNAGVISDNCVKAEDVPPVDADRAVKFLEGDLL